MTLLDNPLGYFMGIYTVFHAPLYLKRATRILTHWSSESAPHWVSLCDRLALFTGTLDHDQVQRDPLDHDQVQRDPLDHDQVQRDPLAR
jgi:hypothetical protein